MRNISARALTALLIFFSIGFLLLGFILSLIPPARDSQEYPSKNDASALQFFRLHQTDFDRLRSLVAAHPALIYLHRERLDVVPKDIFANDAASLNEVLTLMTRLHLTSLNGPASDWGLRLSFAGEGMVMGSTTRSFWFSDIPPPSDRVFASFGNQLPDKSGSGSAYCEIIPRWYLRLDWGG